MLVDLSRAVGTYLHEVSCMQCGLVGAARLRWRKHCSHCGSWCNGSRPSGPARASSRLAFWLFSIGGGVLLLAYALYRSDPVFIAGQAFGVFVYLRNLYFVLREKKDQATA